MEGIHFGTDGWRGVIAENFTFQNVRRVGRALLLLMKEKMITDKPAIIAYDFRFLSEFFARTIHDELIAGGMKSILSDRAIPTPALSLAVKKRRGAFGVMITASHNPHFYNGIKFKASYGGPVMPDFTSDVTRLLKNIPDAPQESPVYAPPVQVKDLLTPYLNALRAYVNFDILKKSRLRVGVDSMFAVGGTLLPDILTGTNITVCSIRTERNPLFGNDLPEPAPPLLGPISRLVRSEKCDAGLATDGDADRIGIVDHEGRFVTLHYLMPLLYEYLVESRGMKGDGVRTTSADPLFDDVCTALGRACHEVPVGFKNVCELVLAKDILVGGEESGGVCFKGHMPERDGLLSGLLTLEMMAAKKKSLADLVADMGRRFHTVEYLRTDRVFDQMKLKANMISLKKTPPERIAESAVVKVDTRDGIKFHMKNGCWMLMRVSDTEPKGRIYVGGPKIKDVRRTLSGGEALLFR